MVDRSVRATNSTRSFGVGSYGYAPPVPREESEFDTGARVRLDGGQTFDDSSPRFEDWSPEKQRAAYEGLRRSDENLAASAQNADDFIALHPEILDTVNNGKRFNSTLKAMFGDCVHTMEQLERVREVLLANNLLELNQAEIEKQRKAATKQRAQAEGARIVNLTEEELEALPLEEIRRRAVIEHQRQMQAAGERGGNGF